MVRRQRKIAVIDHLREIRGPIVTDDRSQTAAFLELHPGRSRAAKDGIGVVHDQKRRGACNRLDSAEGLRSGQDRKRGRGIGQGIGPRRARRQARQLERRLLGGVQIVFQQKRCVREIASSPAGQDHVHRASGLARAKLAGGRIVPQLAIAQRRWIACRRVQPHRSLHRDPGRVLVDGHGGRKRGAVRADLHRQIVVAHQPDLGPRQVILLKHHTRGCACKGLVDRHLVATGRIGEQSGRRFHRQSIGRAGGHRHPQLGELHRTGQFVDPGGSVENLHLGGGGVIGLPAAQRREELPGRAIPHGNVLAMPSPGPAWPRRHDIAIPQGGQGRRRGQIASRDRKLHHHIQKPQGLVVGDMFLRLRRQDMGKRQDRRLFGHWGPPRCTCKDRS